MEIGKTVNTPYGKGEIVDIEHYSRIDGGLNRYGVALENNPFAFPVAYFWPKEVKEVTK